MAGAAAETVFMLMCSKILGLQVLDSRKKNLNNLLESLFKNLKNTDKFDDKLTKKLEQYSDLSKYWRNIAAHADECNLSEYEAHGSLDKLLKFSRFVNTEILPKFWSF